MEGILSDFLLPEVQGLDALGLATINSISIPFLSIPMSDEDVVNLRNFHRLVLLVSGIQGSDAVSSSVAYISVNDNAVTYT